MSTPDLVSALALLVLVGTFGLHLVSLVMSLMRQADRTPAFDDFPPVTLLIPFTGQDPFPERTLNSSLHLTYPRRRIIFCAPSEDEPGIQVVRDMIAEHPEAPLTLLVGRERRTNNPKLDNLEKGWAATTTEWVVIADANIVLPPHYIETLLGTWRLDTGLVTAVPLGTDARSFWADVECAFLNTYQARLQFFADRYGYGYAHGKIMMFKRSLLDQLGGLSALTCDPAEDSAATKIVRQSGQKIRLTASPIEHPLGARRFTEVWGRQLRWAQLRRRSFPRLYALEILSTGMLPCAAAAVLANAAGTPSVVGAAASYAVWCALELMLAGAAKWPVRPLYVPACIVRDVLISGIWVMAWFRTDYIWRGNAVNIGPAALHAAEPTDMTHDDRKE